MGLPVLYSPTHRRTLLHTWHHRAPTCPGPRDQLHKFAAITTTVLSAVAQHLNLESPALLRLTVPASSV